MAFVQLWEANIRALNNKLAEILTSINAQILRYDVKAQKLKFLATNRRVSASFN